MTDFICAFDNEDKDIGSFVQGCRENLEEFFESQSLSPIYIDSRSLNALNIKMRTENLSSFVFVAYSHGNEDTLATRSSNYVSTTENVDSFENAFFYTVSCLSGTNLGQSLIDNGCKCFFGYRTTFSCWLGYREFMDCANFGLIQFVNGQNTEDIYHQMIENYNNSIDNLFPTDFFQASLLRENRDGLVRLGDSFSIDQM